MSSTPKTSKPPKLIHLAVSALCRDWSSATALDGLSADLAKLVWAHVKDHHARQGITPVPCAAMYPLVRASWQVQTLDLSDAGKWITDTALQAGHCPTPTPTSDLTSGPTAPSLTSPPPAPPQPTSGPTAPLTPVHRASPHRASPHRAAATTLARRRRRSHTCPRCAACGSPRASSSAMTGWPHSPRCRTWRLSTCRGRRQARSRKPVRRSVRQVRVWVSGRVGAVGLGSGPARRRGRR